MKDRVQSLLQQEQVQAALSRASSLARQWKVQGTISKIGRFYQGSISPYIRQAHRGKNEETSRGLDGIIAQGLELKITSTGQEEEWTIDVIKWLSDGEVLLRDNIPDEFRKLTVFAARVSPYAGRDRLDQIISERLQLLVEVRKRRRTRSS